MSVNDTDENAANQEDASGRASVSWSARGALVLIGFYRYRISPLTPPSCRFVPTCSHYTYDAIARFGLWRGGWIGAKRICRCHPWNPGGYDPVPETLGLQMTTDTVTTDATPKGEPPKYETPKYEAQLEAAQEIRSRARREAAVGSLGVEKK